MTSENDPFALNSKNIKMDLLHFKDDVLKDIKSMEKIINEKFNTSNNFLKEKLESYDTKLNLYSEKIVQLSNLIIEDKNLKENINKLIEKETILEEKLLTNDIKLKHIEKDYNDKINQINTILSKTVIYPNVIGGISKIKTFHEFIDYVLKHIIQTNTYKEKNTLDLRTYKNKQEALIKNLQMQLDNIAKTSNEFTSKSVNECEEKIKNILSLYDERFQNVRAENNSYIKNLEEYSKELKEEFKKFLNMKNNIISKFNNEVYNIKKDNYQVVKIFGNYKKDFNLIKDRLTKLSEFIKDIRFRKNLGDLKRRDFIDLGNKLDFTKKQNYDVGSEVKKYIKGEINAEELSTSKKFSRSNMNIFEEEFPKNNDLNNSYFSKNLSFRNRYFNNDFNKLEPGTLKHKNECSNLKKRKSVYNLMTPFSLKDYKINSQISNSYMRFPPSNNLDINSELSKEDKKLSLSNDTKIRKRYTSFIGEKNNIVSKLKQLDSFEKFKYNNNQSPTIKEEIEQRYNSNESINSESSYKNSDKKNTTIDESKNNKDKTIIPNLTTNFRKIDKKIAYNNIVSNIHKMNDIKIDCVQKINIEENKNNKKNINIKANRNNIINNIPKNNNIEAKINNNIFNNAPKKNQIEVKSNNYIINNSLKNNNNNVGNINDKNNNFEIIKEKNNKQNSDKKLIKIIKPNNDDIRNKENNYIKNVITSDNSKNNNDIRNLIINKFDVNEQNIKYDNFTKTINNFSFKKNNTYFKLKDKNKKFIDDLQNTDENKSFRGKKYLNMTNSLVMKVKENILLENTNRDRDNNKIQMKQNNKKSLNNNSNMIYFNQDDDSFRWGKQTYSSVPSERNKEAKQIQKMVNNLRSYIINYNNNLDESKSARNTSYKKGNNLSFKDLNISFKTQYKGNNGYLDNNPRTNRENLVNLKLK